MTMTERALRGATKNRMRMEARLRQPSLSECGMCSGSIQCQCERNDLPRRHWAWLTGSCDSHKLSRHLVSWVFMNRDGKGLGTDN